MILFLTSGWKRLWHDAQNSAMITTYSILFLKNIINTHLDKNKNGIISMFGS